MPVPIDRPPRIQPLLPIDEIEVPAPPNKNEGGQSLFELLLPLAMIVGYIALAFSGAGRSLIFIIPLSVAMVGSIYFAYQRSRQAGLAVKAKTEAYAQRLVELRYELQGYHQQQRDFYFYNYPNPEVTIGIVEQREQSRSGPRIWERRSSDEDFGTLRLGVGTRPSTVIYKMTTANNEEDPQLDEALRLCEDSLYVSDVPITIPLRMPFGQEQRDDAPRIRNSIGIYYGSADMLRARQTRPAQVGNQGSHEVVYQYAQALLTHFASFHSYTDTEMYVVGTHQAARRWEWAKQLPHTTISPEKWRLCFEEPPKKNPNTSAPDPLNVFWKSIHKTLQTRQQRMGENGNTDMSLPFMLIVVDLLNLTEESALYRLETVPAISMIMNNGLQLGAAILFLAGTPSKILSDCEAVIELEEIEKVSNPKQVYSIAFRYAEVDVNTPRYVGVADLVSDIEAQKLAQKLSDYTISLSAAASLVNALDLLQLYQVGDIDGLKIQERWRESRNKGEWPRVPIGLKAGDTDPVSLTFSANESGVHGMIAGTTGSGKSELLLTIISGLALNYDPSAVNFLLVDFKGGAAFDEFRQLPHCIDVVTNLDNTAVQRMFSSIKAELDRRGKIIADSQTKHIVDYRTRGLHKTSQPFPHLFIIIDEFAEMVAGNAEYKAQLDSITRLGRAIGVSLILATQRPAGVITDQMRANMKFRICLRVETPEDSRELLRSNDASYLPPNIPGRGYMQIGNEPPDLIQVARAGAPYVAQQNHTPPPVIWQRNQGGDDDEKETEAKELSKVLVERMAQYARQDPEVAKQRKEWPDALPKYLPLNLPISTHYLPNDDIGFLHRHAPSFTPVTLPLNGAVDLWMTGRGGWVDNIWGRNDMVLQATIGLIDHPVSAKQRIVKIDLLKGGNIALFGGGGWGKSTFLRTLVTSFAATHSPRDFQVYIMDMAGRSLEVLTQLPHVGAYIMADQDERVYRLLLILSNLLEERKTVMQVAKADNIVVYNANRAAGAGSAQSASGRSGKHFPALLVVIDGFDEIKENYEHLLPDLTSLLREGRNMGIYFAATAGLPNAMGGKIYNLFSNRMTLTLTDGGEYSNIVGRGSPAFGEIAGRGVIGMDREISSTPLEFQVAAPVGALPQALVQPNRQSEFTPENLAELEGKLLDSYTTQSASLLEKLGQQMQARVKQLNYSPLERPRAIDIADTLDLLQLYRVSDIDELDIVNRWTKSRERGEWPHVDIGFGAGDEATRLTFSAQGSGVHGMIAGTTGSGKSELLLTIIAGLAINYDPSAVNFLLVDYKGGAAFDEFRHLPHCIDVVTNLDKSGVERVFASIKAEIARRSGIIARSQTKHIVDYRERGLHKHQEPFPHLFIIIDEFAEMVSENAEFKAQLDSITRLGRAIGMSLILATQRPAGVITDQMRANMKFRICLRVESAEDSRELLRRPDAASLPVGVPGRAYLQVGNEIPELIQVARAGAKYVPLNPIGYEITADDDETDLSKVLVKYMARLAQTTAGVAVQYKAWPDPLPEYLPLDSRQTTRYLPQEDKLYLSQPYNLPVDSLELVLNESLRRWRSGQLGWLTNIWKQADYVLKAVVGLIDHPSQGEQRLLKINLRNDHTAILGASGSGKTTLLRTIITSFITTHSPLDLHVYILDFGGRALQLFEGLPHVGAVITADERERIERLLRTLNTILEDRKVKIQTKADDIAAYNASRQTNDEYFPSILVVIDNFAEITENMDDLLPVITTLLREGRTVGIHFIATGDRFGAIPSKLFNLFTSRLVLRLTDSTEYPTILGRRGPVFREVSGRGLLAMERDISATALVFQTAAPLGLSEATLQELAETHSTLNDNIPLERRYLDRLSADLTRLVQELVRTIAQQTQVLKDKNLLKASHLPQTIDTLTTYCEYQTLPAPTSHAFGVMFGIEDLGLKPYLLELDDYPHFVMAGPPLSGRTTILRTWILALAENYRPQDVAMVFIDPQQRLYSDGRNFDLGLLPHVLMTVSEKDHFRHLLTKLEAEYTREHVAQHPLPQIFIFIDNYDDMNYIAEQGDINKLAQLVRAHQNRGLHVILAKGEDRSSDPLYKQLWQRRFGLALQSEKAIEQLDSKMPRSMRNTQIPTGRGFIVTSGRTLLVQTASFVPQGEEEHTHQLLKTATENIHAQWIQGSYAIGTSTEGISLFNPQGAPDVREVTQGIRVYENQLASDLNPADWLKVSISHDETDFIIIFENVSHLSEKPLVFGTGMAALHLMGGRIPIVGQDNSLMALAANPLDLANADLGRDVKSLSQVIQQITPQQKITFRTAAQLGDALSFLIMVDTRNVWYDDLFPQNTSPIAGRSSGERNTETIEELAKTVDVDPNLRLLPVRQNTGVLAGLNQRNPYNRLLNAETLKLLPLEMVQSLGLQLGEGIQLAQIATYPTEQLQELIDTDVIVLPRLSKEQVEQIRAIRDQLKGKNDAVPQANN